jgi:hypothetical protein
MRRGPVFFVIQLGIILTLSSVGVWAVIGPRHLQAFLNENFALLPVVRPGSLSTIVASNLLRLAGFGLVFYGCRLLENLKEEMVWLAKLLRLVQ